MTAYTGTVKRQAPDFPAGGWSPITVGRHGHSNRILRHLLRYPLAADTVSNGDTVTFTFTYQGLPTSGLGEIVGVYLVFESDIDESGTDYWTISVTSSATEIATHTTANGLEAGQAFEVTRTGSAAERSSGDGVAGTVVLTATVGATAPALQDNICLVIVMQEPA